MFLFGSSSLLIGLAGSAGRLILLALLRPGIAQTIEKDVDVHDNLKGCVLLRDIVISLSVIYDF